MCKFCISFAQISIMVLSVMYIYQSPMEFSSCAAIWLYDAIPCHGITTDPFIEQSHALHSKFVCVCSISVA